MPVGNRNKLERMNLENIWMEKTRLWKQPILHMKERMAIRKFLVRNLLLNRNGTGFKGLFPCCTYRVDVDMIP